jgi:hypothetical protein
MPTSEEIVREACETIRCGPAFAVALDALVAERDEQFAADNDRIHLLCEQREAAEAECERLREALTNIEGYVGTRDYAYVEVNDMAEIARAALGEDA